MSPQLRYGLIGGVICSISYLSILHSSLGKMVNPLVNSNFLLVLGCLLVVLIFALLKVKKLSGALDFGTALKVGLAVTIVTGVILSFSCFMYLHWINPSWFAMQKVYWVSNHAKIPPRPTAWQASLFVMIVNNIPGSVLSLILALILKSRSK